MPPASPPPISSHTIRKHPHFSPTQAAIKAPKEKAYEGSNLQAQAAKQMAMTPSASAVSFSARPLAAVRPRAASACAGRDRGMAAEGGKWWAPLLGWSGRADYIEAAAPVTATEETEKEARRRPSSSFVGGLTEEKARELRARMVETESFHDAMYHSAIASRLARSA